MNKLNYFKLLVRSYFPTQLPVGMTAFGQFAEDIYTLTGPIADFDSIKFALAQKILHADEHRSNPPMQYFVRRLVKTAANQVAAQVFQDVKLAQEARKKAAEELAAAQPIAEVTADVKAVTDGRPE